MKKTTKNRRAPVHGKMRPFGWVLGQGLSALAIEHAELVSADASLRTVQEYLSGGHVSRDKADAVRRAVGTRLSGAFRKMLPVAPTEFAAVIEDHGPIWEHWVGILEGGGLSTGPVHHLVHPVMRIASIDIAVRYGAWQCLIGSHGLDAARPALESPASWLQAEAFARCLRRLMVGDGQPSTTGEALAAAVGVSPKDVSKWLNGHALPTSDNLMSVANQLDPSGELAVEERLRRARAGSALRRELQRVVDPDVIDDCLRFADRLADAVTRELQSMFRADAVELARATPASMRWLVAHLVLAGGHSPEARQLLSALTPRLDLNEEAGQDVQAVSQGRTAIGYRLEAWRQRSAAMPVVREQIRAFLPRGQRLDEIADLVLDRTDRGAGYPMGAPGPRVVAQMGEQGLHLARFEVAVPAGPLGVELLASRAAAAVSRNDRPTAIRLLQQGVDLSPTSATAHYKLGCTLGDVDLNPTLEDLMHAESELHVAHQLEPQRSDIMRELGVVLSNQHRFAEAEAAYARAAALGADDPHFWLARSRTLAWAERYEDALGAAESVRDATGMHAREAVEMCAAALFMLGRRREASNRWRQTHAWREAKPLDEPTAQQVFRSPYPWSLMS